MAEDNTSLLARFNGYSRQPITRQLALLVGLAASIALGLGLVQWAVKPAYKPLYGAMAPEDTNEVIAALEAAGIEYNLDARSGILAVPAGQLQRARLSLASGGYPRGDAMGFESLYREQEIGVSNFMEQARFHRSLEAELSRTISAMESVRSARVHLAMAKQSAFLRQRERPAASVMLNLYAGRQLSDRQLAGVIHLVASSVPNLDAEQVSVVDQKGKLLSAQGSDEAFGFTQEQLRYTRLLENDLRQRIVTILEPILGPGAVQAQVAAAVDFTRVERTSEAYSPETRLRSEQTSEESSSQRLSGGVPGTLSNQPPIDTTLETVQAGAAPAVEGEQDAAAQPARTSRRATRNYEMDKTISHVRETPGTVQKLSIAVVLDYVETEGEDGSVIREPMPQARVDEITALVREAVGFNAARGDSVSVMSASFVAAEAEVPVEMETSLLDQEWVWQLGKGLMVLIVLLSLVFGVLRPLMKFSAVPVVPAPQALASPQGEAAAAEMLMAEDQVTLGGPGQNGQLGLPASPGGYQEELQMARSTATGEPERAAYVVKNWVAADG